MLKDKLVEVTLTLTHTSAIQKVLLNLEDVESVRESSIPARDGGWVDVRELTMTSGKTHYMSEAEWNRINSLG